MYKMIIAFLIVRVTVLSLHFAINVRFYKEKTRLQNSITTYRRFVFSFHLYIEIYSVIMHHTFCNKNQ